MKLKIFILLLICSSLIANAQSKKYLSFGVGVNQSTFLLDPGFIAEGEFNRMWGESLYPSPEVSGQFNFCLNERNIVAIAADIVYYQRIISLAMPISVRYDFNFTKKEKCPFIRLNGGYSFFLTNGGFYGMGLGYRLGKVKTSLTYNNQFKNNSILEDNEFIAARIASLSFKLEYAFINNKRNRKTRR
ncbi:MAG: hypothetical protein CMO01_30795 [Thalassobius sp.]|nr:hypothetical protein [Thalassovita sp.]